VSRRPEDLSQEVDIWSKLVIPQTPPPVGQQSGETAPSGTTVGDWDRLQIVKMVHAVHSDTTRAENRVRRNVSYVIVAAFFAWAVVGMVYIMFFSGQLQSLLDGSAFVAGPLGVVMGYYFGKSDKG
jgi:hypothetical protein